MRKRPKNPINEEDFIKWANSKRVDYSRDTIVYEGQRALLLMETNLNGYYFVSVRCYNTEDKVYKDLYYGESLEDAVKTYNSLL